jgi:23S rRNA (adenine2503-C2)-methyltransferase
MSDDIHLWARLPEEWRAWMAARGQPAYRGEQIFRWIHARGVADPAAMTDLPAALREELAKEDWRPAARVERVHRSADGTRKLLIELADGARVETVLLPVCADSDDADAAAADDDDDETTAAYTRVTQCISTQVGCAMGCVFCASGVAGLKRHMSAGEIVAQVWAAREYLEPGEALRGIVFMGMGEPLHNYDATARAIRVLTDAKGIALSPKRLTVSTSGLVPEIGRLGRDFAGKVGLAISLHQADDARRSALMPVNQRYPLAELMRAVKAYPLGKRRRVTMEYTLVAGQNDEPADAKRVARLLAGMRVKVNLIPMNPIEHSELGPPDMARVEAFQRVLAEAGIPCFVRRRRGDDVSAACGQLVLAGERPNARFLSRQPRS